MAAETPVSSARKACGPLPRLPMLPEADEEALPRHREAQILANNMLVIFEACGAIDGIPWVVMEALTCSTSSSCILAARFVTAVRTRSYGPLVEGCKAWLFWGAFG